MRYLPALSIVALALTGCAVTDDILPALEPGVQLEGTVHGGQQAIVGAHVYLLRAGTTGYGGRGIAASTSNASVSLLTSKTGLSDSIGYYVLTNSTGGFTITGDYTCVAGTQVYLYVLGGNPGAGTNTASGLLSVLGACPTAGNFTTQLSNIVVNEVTTVAAAYSLAGFATNATHISSSGTTLAQTGIANAFANALLMVPSSTGVAAATNPAKTAVVPQAMINTLANILMSCVNSASATATPCTTLMSNATSGGTAPVTPTETATAAIDIAHNPTSNVAALYAIPAPKAPFTPALTAKPADFALTLTYNLATLAGAKGVAIDASGNAWVSSYSQSKAVKLSPAGVSLGSYVGNLASPGGIAIDKSGNAWVASSNLMIKVNATPTAGSAYYTTPAINDTFFGIAIDGVGDIWSADSYNYTKSTISRFTSTGSVLSGNGFTTAGLATPDAVAIDGGGNAWAVNVTGPVVSKMTSAGATASGTTGFLGTGIFAASSIAIDASGNAWTANNNSSVSKLSNTGAILSGSTGYVGGGVSSPQAIAIDGAGNAWVASLTALSGLSSTGTFFTGSTGITSPAFSNAAALAIDGSGNIWVANFQGTNGISELIGAAAPVVTPIAAGLPATPYSNGTSTMGTRP